MSIKVELYFWAFVAKLRCLESERERECAEMQTLWLLPLFALLLRKSPHFRRFKAIPPFELFSLEILLKTREN